MKVKFDKIWGLEVLIMLLVINYMIITIILKDTILLKFSRDIVVLILFVLCLNNGRFSRNSLFWVAMVVFLGIGFIKSESTSLAIVSVRKYIFPILALVAVERFPKINRDRFTRLINFILPFFAVISVWGVFQAWVLKDTFLMNLGYPTMYSYAYRRTILNYSFYFGNLGIQRVVSTISNSNVCGIILGATLVFSVFMYPYITNKRKNLYMILIFIAYVLTFSRSNFLALLIVVLMIMYRYIPYKDKLWIVVGVGVLGVVILSFVQGENGLINKLLNWVINSLNLSDASVAGRSERWTAALQEVVQNPMGIGMGHVGALAINGGATKYFDCENSYLAIALDCGVIGLIVYLANVVGYIRWFTRYRVANNVQFIKRASLCGKSMLIYILVVMFFSNHIYDMEAIAMVYIYVGVLINMVKNQVDQEFITSSESRIRSI